jgi:hypothetical protein
MVGNSETSGSLYGVIITVYGVITTLFIVMPDLNPNNSQINIKWGLGAVCCYLIDLPTLFSLKLKTLGSYASLGR